MTHETEDVLKFLPMVSSIVRKIIFDNRFYDDLFSAGTIGLIKALRNFDVSRGAKISTYIHIVVCHAILKEQSKLLKYERESIPPEVIETYEDRRTPSSIYEKIQSLKSQEREIMEMYLIENMSKRKIARELHMSRAKVHSIIYNCSLELLSIE